MRSAPSSSHTMCVQRFEAIEARHFVALGHFGAVGARVGNAGESSASQASIRSVGRSGNAAARVQCVCSRFFIDDWKSCSGCSELYKIPIEHTGPGLALKTPAVRYCRYQINRKVHTRYGTVPGPNPPFCFASGHTFSYLAIH